MNKDFCYIIDQICREKGIPKDAVLKALESALLSAAKKRFSARRNVELRIDPDTCEIQLSVLKDVVEDVSSPEDEISLEEARRIDPEKNIGDQVAIPLELHDFGRIAAQTAKQVIVQKVREAEREIVYNEFKDKVGRIVSGVVTRKERGVYYVNLGRVEAQLPYRETLPGENLKRGDAIKALVQDVRISPKGPEILLSRTSPDFVAELFRTEVPEIDDRIVVIENIVREPGERTKIAVTSNDPSIDPVGACVGMKGTRVQAIVRELRGERIDIIPWSDDPRMLISRALSPATVDRIGINEEDRTAMVVVNDQQLSIAIGKRGQNVRLAMKLTGWEIDIISESEYSKIKQDEAESAFGEAIADSGAATEEDNPEE
ncbi:MAG TPA: transcription termination/antitermination protein NusA [Nitrospirae bacterium]|nr:transcription termination/antitermination protein NusA [Nitrospirota bacterium]